MRADELRGHNGFSLIEVMLAVAVLSIVSVALGMFFVNTSSADLRTRVSAARVVVVEQIRQNARAPISMNRSSLDTDNARLKKCLDNSAPNPPCRDGQKYDLKLLDAKGQVLASGSPGVLYDVNAKPGCTGTACPFRAITGFRPRCPGGANCNSPNDVILEVYYTVDKNPSYVGKIQTFAKITNDPDDPDIVTDAVPVMIRATEINSGTFYP